MSLVISLTCALLATLVQQWARHYLKNAYQRYRPHQRARLCAFHKHGVEKQHIPWTMEAVPVLLYLSLFLFFTGLSVFLFGIHQTIFKVVTAWIALCVVLYACLTILPYMYKNSPYSTPLSAPVFSSLTGIRYIFFRFLRRFQRMDPSICIPLRDPWTVHLDDFFSYSMRKTAEKFAFKLKPDIDYKLLLGTFESLDEDTDLETFFERLPRLRDSKIGKELDLQHGFVDTHKGRLSSALIGLMDRTLSSNLVSESVKQRRMIICTKTVESTSLLEFWYILHRVLFGDWYRFLGCIEFGLLVQNWENISDKATSFSAQCVAALTISIVQRDERWIQLVSGLLNVSNSLLHKYVANGDSILLANVIFIIRRTVQAYSGSAERNRNNILSASSRTLEALCTPNIQGTLPELQYEFCDLWNLLVQTAKTDPLPQHVFISTMTLKNVRKLFLTFHDGARTPPTVFNATTNDQDPALDNPETYPSCIIFEHRPFLPIPGLQFDEPAPDATGDVPPTPDIIPMPIPTFQYPPAQPSFTTPYYSSLPPALYPTLPVPSLYGAPVVVSRSTDLPDARVSSHEPHLTRSRASNALRVGDVQPPPPPLPTPSRPGSASSALSIHRTMYPPNASDSWGGHV